jgi:hypothetical protein
MSTCFGRDLFLTPSPFQGEGWGDAHEALSKCGVKDYAATKTDLWIGARADLAKMIDCN